MRNWLVLEPSDELMPVGYLYHYLQAEQSTQASKQCGELQWQQGNTKVLGEKLTRTKLGTEGGPFTEGEANGREYQLQRTSHTTLTDQHQADQGNQELDKQLRLKQKMWKVELFQLKEQHVKEPVRLIQQQEEVPHTANRRGAGRGPGKSGH